jgi:hypothetical protein
MGWKCMQGFGREQITRKAMTYVRQDSLNYERFIVMPFATVITSKNGCNGSIA